MPACGVLEAGCGGVLEDHGDLLHLVNFTVGDPHHQVISLVVEHTGIMPQVRAAAADVQGMKFVDADDRIIARINTQEPGAVEIMRGDLVALLHEATGPGVEFIFDDSIRQLDQDDDA